VALRQAPVDVLGVVTEVGQLGTVKRKVDASELPRRDITLADDRCDERLSWWWWWCVCVCNLGVGISWTCRRQQVLTGLCWR
jgi:hypothetical protein